MNFDFRKRPPDLLCSNVKGGAFSSGNSILMQRERGKQKDKSKKQQEKRSGGRQNRWAEAGGAGSGKGGKRKRQRGSKLSNKQEKAKGKAQESRHQNRFPPLFDRAPPFTFEHKRSRSLFWKIKVHSFNLLVFA